MLVKRTLLENEPNGEDHCSRQFHGGVPPISAAHLLCLQPSHKVGITCFVVISIFNRVGLLRGDDPAQEIEGGEQIFGELLKSYSHGVGIGLNSHIIVSLCWLNFSIHIDSLAIANVASVV